MNAPKIRTQDMLTLVLLTSIATTVLYKGNKISMLGLGQGKLALTAAGALSGLATGVAYIAYRKIGEATGMLTELKEKDLNSQNLGDHYKKFSLRDQLVAATFVGAALPATQLVALWAILKVTPSFVTTAVSNLIKRGV